jgi:hypothetical protein
MARGAQAMALVPVTVVAEPGDAGGEEDGEDREERDGGEAR